jgi:hypothetical protein
LPSKSGAAPTWDDVDRFLDAQKHLVIETSKLLVPVNDGIRKRLLDRWRHPQGLLGLPRSFRD